MNIVRSDEAKRFESAESCVVFEYLTGSPAINVARAEIRGRYPLSGNACNKEVAELAYVTAGEGIVHVNGTSQTLQKGDVILLEKGEQVWWEGNLTLIISCAPAWKAEQYEIV
jgi:mannose-6-phosphate isomerase-like protein (cupin superfamily)